MSRRLRHESITPTDLSTFEFFYNNPTSRLIQVFLTRQAAFGWINSFNRKKRYLYNIDNNLIQDSHPKDVHNASLYNPILENLSAYYRTHKETLTSFYPPITPQDLFQASAHIQQDPTTLHYAIICKPPGLTPKALVELSNTTLSQIELGSKANSPEVDRAAELARLSIRGLK